MPLLSEASGVLWMWSWTAHFTRRRSDAWFRFAALSETPRQHINLDDQDTLFPDDVPDAADDEVADDQDEPDDPDADE